MASVWTAGTKAGEGATVIVLARDDGGLRGEDGCRGGDAAWSEVDAGTIGQRCEGEIRGMPVREGTRVSLGRQAVDTGLTMDRKRCAGVGTWGAACVRTRTCSVRGAFEAPEWMSGSGAQRRGRGRGTLVGATWVSVGLGVGRLGAGRSGKDEEGEEKRAQDGA